MTTLKDSVTGNDNTFEFIFIASVVAFLIGMGLEIWTVVFKNAVFSLVDFGIGVGSLFTGTGLGYGAKKYGDSKETQSSTTTTTIAPAITTTTETK